MYYNTGNLCIGCMQPLGDSSTCLNCHTERSYVQPSPYLPLRTVIDNKYLVGKVQDYNGDSVAYMSPTLKRTTEFYKRILPQGATQSTNNINLMPMSGKEMVLKTAIKLPCSLASDCETQRSFGNSVRLRYC